jgi:hypothetical protein
LTVRRCSWMAMMAIERSEAAFIKSSSLHGAVSVRYKCASIK